MITVHEAEQSETIVRLKNPPIYAPGGTRLECASVNPNAPFVATYIC